LAPPPRLPWCRSRSRPRKIRPPSNHRCHCHSRPDPFPDWHTIPRHSWAPPRCRRHRKGNRPAARTPPRLHARRSRPIEATNPFRSRRRQCNSPTSRSPRTAARARRPKFPQRLLRRCWCSCGRRPTRRRFRPGPRIPRTSLACRRPRARMRAFDMAPTTRATPAWAPRARRVRSAWWRSATAPKDRWRRRRPHPQLRSASPAAMPCSPPPPRRPQPCPRPRRRADRRCPRSPPCPGASRGRARRARRRAAPRPPSLRRTAGRRRHSGRWCRRRIPPPLPLRCGRPAPRSLCTRTRCTRRHATARRSLAPRRCCSDAGRCPTAQRRPDCRCNLSACPISRLPFSRRGICNQTRVGRTSWKPNTAR